MTTKSEYWYVVKYDSTFGIRWWPEAYYKDRQIDRGCRFTKWGAHYAARYWIWAHKRKQKKRAKIGSQKVFGPYYV